MRSFFTSIFLAVSFLGYLASAEQNPKHSIEITNDQPGHLYRRHFSDTYVSRRRALHPRSPNPPTPEQALVNADHHLRAGSIITIGHDAREEHMANYHENMAIANPQHAQMHHSWRDFHNENRQILAAGNHSNAARQQVVDRTLNRIGDAQDQEKTRGRSMHRGGNHHRGGSK